jgi:hypothetical protein
MLNVNVNVKSRGKAARMLHCANFETSPDNPDISQRSGGFSKLLPGRSLKEPPLGAALI